MAAISYKVEITRIIDDVGPVTEYQKISDTGNPVGDGPVYSYIENPKKATHVEQVVLSQVLDGATFNIGPVIKSVNNL